MIRAVCVRNFENTVNMKFVRNVSYKFRILYVQIQKYTQKCFRTSDLYVRTKPHANVQNFHFCTYKVCASVYLSVKCEHKSLILDSFEQWCEQYINSKSAVMMGDFNIDLFTITTHSRRLSNFCDDNGLSNLIISATRTTEYSATLIGLCLLNLDASRVDSQAIFDDQISDNAIIESVIKGQCDIILSKIKKN